MDADDRPGWATRVAAVLVAAGVVALQLRHSSTPGIGQRPSGWPVTLVLLALLSLVFYPSTGASSLLLLAFVGASAMLLIRHWSRWLLLGGIAVGVPVLTFVDPAQSWTVTETITWGTYASATLTVAALLVFGLARLTQTATALGEVQEQIAQAARVQERLRLARDAHDVLGLGLSTIALKTDLVAALMEQDPVRSRHEGVQALHLARLVATDVDAVNGDRLSFTIATEVSTARQSLAAADVRADIEVDPDLPDLDALAAVLREAVTNVLRHSRATHCRIRLTSTRRVDRPGRGQRRSDAGRRRGARPRAREHVRAPARRARIAEHPSRRRGVHADGRGPRMITILLAEDTAILRDTLVAVLDLEEDMQVVAQVSHGDQILPAARRWQPSVAILDIDLPGQDGLTAARQLATDLPGCRVLILTALAQPANLRTALDAGVAGFLAKDTPAVDLIRAVREIDRGGRVIDPAVAVAALDARPPR